MINDRIYQNRIERHRRDGFTAEAARQRALHDVDGWRRLDNARREARELLAAGATPEVVHANFGDLLTPAECGL